MMNSKLDSFKKPFVVVGLGKSGLAAAELLKTAGIEPTNIRLFDEKKPVDIMQWSEIDQLKIGTLIVSPGVPLKNENIVRLAQLGWTVSSEISLACQFITDEKTIGITGSVAKSTVTTLIGLAAKAMDAHAFVGGNLGIPFCEYAISVLKEQPKAKWIVLELSSYQLENCSDLKLNHSVITYLSANHLERYSSKKEYYLTKCAIGKMTAGSCVINESSADLIEYKKNITCSVRGVSAQKFENKALINSIQLLGEHNRDNFAMAFEITKLCGFTDTAILEMTKYRGLAHRIEIVAEHKNVCYINDSKATAMDSVLVAAQAGLEKIKSSGVVHLLLGGKDKNLPWADLQVLNTDPKIKIIYFGECGLIAKEKMQNMSSPYFQTLNAALPQVLANAKPYDVVLLSPGGTSLDEFKNFEDRGDFFKNKVLNFIQKNG